MANAFPTGDAPQRNWILPLIALVFTLLAWGAVALGRDRVNRLDLSRWGTDLDIPERLAIDRYLYGHFRPYILAAVALDGLALGALCWAGRRGRLGWFGTGVVVVWLLFAGWHGIQWLITSFFAG